MSSTDHAKRKELSIVVPLYNEEESVIALHEAISAAIRPMQVDYEIIFVDDGSKDDTVNRAIALTHADPHLRVIEFRRNCGQTPAMAAGIDNAAGRILVTMDGDLQNDPSDIPMMVAELHKGYDIVVGWRHNRQDALLSRKIPSVAANWLIGKVTGVPIKDNGCSLKVYRAEVMKSIPFYNEMHRFIPALLSISGARVSQVKVNHHARRFGKSKYGLGRIYRVLFDLLTIKTILSVLSHPVRWFGLLSLIPFSIGIPTLIFAMERTFQNQSGVVPGSISLLLLSLSVFILSLGLICELIYARGNLKLSDIAPLTSRIDSTSA